MTRDDAVKLALSLLDANDLVVAADGAIAREAYRFNDRLRNFYMLGSMGQVASISLGLAMTRNERVVALDGDGNLMMGLGGLAMAGGIKPGRFYHLVLDNGCYATTGGQHCLSQEVDLSEVARGAGYAWTQSTTDEKEAEESLQAWLSAPSPALLKLQVETHDHNPAPRIPMTPEEMAQRFRSTLLS